MKMDDLEKLDKKEREQIERREERDATEQQKRRRGSVEYGIDFFKKNALFLTVAAAVVCVIINVVLTKESLWSAIAALWLGVAYVCVFDVLAKGRGVNSILMRVTLTVPLAIVATDLILWADFGEYYAFGMSLSFAAPVIITGLLVAVDVMSAIKGADGYAPHLIALFVLSLAVQIVVWIFREMFFPFVSLGAFVFAIVNGAVMLVLFRRAIYGGIKRIFKKKD